MTHFLKYYETLAHATLAQLLQKEGTWVEGTLKGAAEIVYADHRVQATFTNSDQFEVPAKVVYAGTGFEQTILDDARFEQTAGSE